MHDDYLSRRLLAAEKDFLTALESGAKMLSTYHRTWSALSDALSLATETGSAGSDKFILINFVASRISNLASCFLDIKHEEELFTSQLQSDCDAMFHQMAALDLNAQPKPSSPADTRTSVLNVDNSSPFLVPAYQWLLDNLHNPYPSPGVKAQIAAASCCRATSVNSWFINARRRIGWTALCREHFSNCRADILDAAYRALVEEHPQRPLSPELRHSFVAMKVAAEGLYSLSLTRSVSASDLDAVLKDATTESGVGKRDQVGKAGVTKASQDPYPSPNPSLTASPVLALDDSLSDESEDVEDTTPPIIAGGKRRRSLMQLADQPSSTTSRPTKRLRACVTSRTSLPSPPLSIEDANELLYHDSPDLSPAHSIPSNSDKVLPPRKQRLSDADVTRIPECPNDSLAAPGLHTASDFPLPSNTGNDYSIDDWFTANFDDLFTIPPPVDAVQPDFSASWEVELFKDYSIPGDRKYASKYAPALTTDLHTFAPSNLSSPDNLVQFVGSHTCVITSDGVLPSSIIGADHTTSLESSMPIARTDIDWESLLNTTEAFDPTTCALSHQHATDSRPLQEIDLSMLQLPQVTLATHPRGDSASRQAKLERLHAMQEEVWRMERELRSEGVVL